MSRSLPLSVLILVVTSLAVALASCEPSDRAPTLLAAKDPREVPPPITRTEPAVVHVDLVAEEVVGEIMPGKTFAFWTFNGTVPGPMIRVMEGDTVEVTLHNALGNREPHNLDFHAATGPGGGGPVSNVAPGDTKTFSFRARRRGAYAYHCMAEGMPWEHIAHGMYGLIQVDPPGGLPAGFQEYYVGQGEWYLGEGGEKEEEEEEEGEGAAPGPQPTFTLDMEKASAEGPDLFTFNGHSEALTSPRLFGGAMRVQQDAKVRIFFVNGGPNKISSLHVVGAIFDRAYGSNPDDAVRNEEVLLVAPTSAAVVELEMPVPGSYELIDHTVFRAAHGAIGRLTVTPTTAPTPEDPNGSWPTEIYGPPPGTTTASTP